MMIFYDFYFLDSYVVAFVWMRHATKSPKGMGGG
jgi:hypothetical protein